MKLHPTLPCCSLLFRLHIPRSLFSPESVPPCKSQIGTARESQVGAVARRRGPGRYQAPLSTCCVCAWRVTMSRVCVTLRVCSCVTQDRVRQRQEEKKKKNKKETTTTTTNNKSARRGGHRVGES
eukprot:2991184-Rhodomonas_salina.1